jgi:hypothetical protein
MQGLAGELRRLSVKPSPMPQGIAQEEPVKVEPAVRVRRVFNAGSDAERKFAENMATIATAFRNGLITQERAEHLASKL